MMMLQFSASKSKNLFHNIYSRFEKYLDYNTSPKTFPLRAIILALKGKVNAQNDALKMNKMKL